MYFQSRIFFLFRFTVNEALDFILNDREDANIQQRNISIIPPTEDGGAVTDCDSEMSEDENEGIIHHLPRRILQAVL